MEAQELRELSATLKRVAAAANADAATARQVRDALAESGLLEVYGAGEALDVVDLLDSGGEGALRARLAELPVAALRRIIAAREYDPEKESGHWRATKLSDLIVAQARRQLEQEQAAAASNPHAVATSWML